MAQQPNNQPQQSAPGGPGGGRGRQSGSGGGDKRGPRPERGRQDRGRGGRGQEKDSEWQERVIQIRRVTKVVKGGKNMSFSALVVVGDLKGNLGVGFGKASEVVEAIRKAIDHAKKNLVKLPFDQGSLPHDVEARSGATKILLLKAPKGTGLIAPWAAKMAMEVAGLHNVVCKVHGSRTPANVLAALQEAVSHIRTKGQIRSLRGSQTTEA